MAFIIICGIVLVAVIVLLCIDANRHSSWKDYE